MNLNEQRIATLEFLQTLINAHAGEGKLFTTESKYDTQCTNGEYSENKFLVLEEKPDIVTDLGELMIYDEADVKFIIRDEYLRISVTISDHLNIIYKRLKVTFPEG